MKRVLVILLCVLGLAATAQAQNQPPAINYIGFNDFIDDRSVDTDKVFTEYITAILPIMERYGMTLETYRVHHSSSDSLQADAITFGTAPDQEKFAAFFADPAFQAVFPKLVGIIKGHTVVMTSGTFAPAFLRERKEDTLLSVYWFDGDATAKRGEFDRLQTSLAQKMERFGVSVQKETTGMAANEGLGAGVKAVDPPHLLTLRTFRDAHGYFDDPLVQRTRTEIHQILKTKGGFWIKNWE